MVRIPTLGLVLRAVQHEEHGTLARERLQAPGSLLEILPRGPTERRKSRLRHPAAESLPLRPNTEPVESVSLRRIRSRIAPTGQDGLQRALQPVLGPQQGREVLERAQPRAVPQLGTEVRVPP